MRTFLLHGGATSRDNIDNDRFFGQFTGLVNKPKVKILLCYWARKPDLWEERSSKDKGRILKNTRKLTQIHVVKDAKDLFSKIDDFDVFYVAGGEAELLEPYYPKIENLKQRLDGKIYAGSSMGAFLAAEQYVLSSDSRDSKSVHKGLGLLPIQILCHWDVEKDKQRKLDLLQGSSEKPIITLDEYKSVVFYQK